MLLELDNLSSENIDNHQIVMEKTSLVENNLSRENLLVLLRQKYDADVFTSNYLEYFSSKLKGIGIINQEMCDLESCYFECKLARESLLEACSEYSENKSKNK